MKIGIVIRRFHTRGGTERRTRELVRWLLDAGHEVHLFAEAWDNELTDGISSHRIRTVKLARWLKALSFAVLAAQATRKWNLDLVHSQARTYADDVATLGGGCHADYLDHFLEDAPPLQRIWERNHAFNRVTMALEKAQYRRCSRLILNSSFAMRGLLRYFPDARAKCRVVHNGVDSEFFRPDIELRKKMRATLAVPEGALIFLFAGSGFAR
ncbi:MAG: glycosyltransferase, partial [Armatimonadetes bacterium]|nr:glycosyltransferase [Armatimonadota bacterium]NIM23626.1 glycosyltransferase [Armatimonadota bacterium]NIM67493.1 glycosyltransferase [Armatimonadota bacterium]NIM75989.1 glycosyltransferase [Armatimonadota bacterium]NIN05678.1 glycosyltransferase [Armatimonadota bacterium]